MATFKAIVFEHQKRRDGTYSVKIRVNHNQKTKYLSTGLVATKDDMTKSFKLKSYFFIDETDKIIKKYRDICNKNALILADLDVSQVVELIVKSERSDKCQIDIIDFGRNALKKEKKGTARNIQCALNNLIKFVGRERIDINEITAKLIKDWINWIEGTRAKSMYPACIRKLHNEAKREYNVEELGIIKIPLSPFSIVKLPKEPIKNDIDIPVEKVRELFRLKDKDISRYNLARDVFMISFCLWGTNAIDLYECTDYRDGRISYNRAKTKDKRSDGAKISIKVEPEIVPLLEKYRDKTGKRVFRFYKMYSDSGTFNAAIGKGLRGNTPKETGGIRKDLGIDYLTFYSARHSFATIAINDVGIDKYMVHQMLNHVDEKMKVTDIYIRKSWKPLDEANRKLLDYVFKQ